MGTETGMGKEEWVLPSDAEKPAPESEPGKIKIRENVHHRVEKRKQKIRTAGSGRRLPVFSFFIVLTFTVLQAVLKLYRLTEIPFGLHIDEAGMAYDAWCLANHGVDRYLQSFPVYLINFGRGQSALYAYLSALVMKLNGGAFSKMAVRLPGVIVSILAYLAALKILRKCIGKNWDVLGAILLAIIPYFTMQCRIGLDCNLLVNMITISVAVTIFATEKEIGLLYFLAGILWGLTYYSYALSYLPNTIILVIVLLGMLVNRKSFGHIAAFVLPIVLLGLPLLVMVFTNMKDGETIRFLMLTIPKLPEFAGSELITDVEAMTSNITEVLRKILLFDTISYNSIADYYVLSALSIPFVVAGFFIYIFETANEWLHKRASWRQIWGLIFICYFVLGCMLGGNGVNINKVNGIFFAEFFMALTGIRGVYRLIRRHLKKLSVVFLLLVFAGYGISFVNFGHYYYNEYAADVFPQKYFVDLFPELLKKAEEEYPDRELYLDEDGSYYIYYALTKEMDPYELDLPKNVREEEKIYGKAHLYVPKEVDPDGLYIISKGSEKFLEILKNRGFTVIEDRGYYEMLIKE